MATLTEIVTVLKAVKRGSEYYACCPAHSDRKPSLSITEKHGKVHFYCHAGCNQEAVADAMRALGLWGQGEYNGAVVARERARIRAPITSPRGPCVAKYDYTDESGELLYQVMRFEPGEDGLKKSFRQRQPDSSRADGWRYDLKGARPVLYHLPEVVAATRVVLVEGEKDVETLRAHGYVATTGAGGSKNWQPDAYSIQLANKMLTVIPDRDDSGSKWLKAVLDSFAGKNVSGEVINLKNTKDITEFAEKGGSIKELIG